MRSIVASVLLASALVAHAQHLTAEEAVRIALENNHGVRIARSNADIAALANNAGSAGMLPQVLGAGQYSVDNAGTKQEFFTSPPREVDNANTKVVAASVELDWTLFDGLRMFATKDRLEALERIGRTQLKQEMEGTAYDVLSTYYLLVQLEKAVLVQGESMRTSRERMRIVETSLRLGSSSGLDQVQARSDLNADSAQVLALLQQANAARTSLNALMARDPSTAFDVDTVIPAVVRPDLPSLRQSALQTNSALQQAREQHIVAASRVKELRGALLPQLNGFANYGYARTTSDVGVLKSNQRIGPQYGLTVAVPLFRGGAVSTMKQAQLGRDVAALTVEQQQLHLEQSLQDAWDGYLNATQRLALEESNLGGARRQMGVALESYRIGVITAVELRDVQQGIIDAENRLLTARYEAKIAELQLNWLAGKLI